MIGALYVLAFLAGLTLATWWFDRWVTARITSHVTAALDEAGHE